MEYYNSIIWLLFAPILIFVSYRLIVRALKILDRNDTEKDASAKTE